MLLLGSFIKSPSFEICAVWKGLWVLCITLLLASPIYLFYQAQITPKILFTHAKVDYAQEKSPGSVRRNPADLYYHSGK